MRDFRIGVCLWVGGVVLCACLCGCVCALYMHELGCQAMTCVSEFTDASALTLKHRSRRPICADWPSRCRCKPKRRQIGDGQLIQCAQFWSCDELGSVSDVHSAHTPLI